jgi:hypothetical protein
MPDEEEDEPSFFAKHKTKIIVGAFSSSRWALASSPRRNRLPEKILRPGDDFVATTAASSTAAAPSTTQGATTRARHSQRGKVHS